MKKYFFAIILSIFLFFYSCSTQKNTTVTRSYHNLTAHYNVYFNGLTSFQEGEQKVNKNYKDNFSQLLPVYKYTIDDAAKLARSDMDRTLEKMGKTIAIHSITVKPKLKGNLTPKDREFLKKNEYCKWIDDAYLLMGKANYFNRDYTKALRAFRRIQNVYKTENTRFEAELWTAKVYLQQEKYKEAYNYLSELENDVRHPKELDKDLNLTFADYYIRQKDYVNAEDRLNKAIKLTKKRNEKARYYYILAQLAHLNGNDQLSADYYKKVTKLTSDYDMVFSAKIMRATVFAKGQNSADIKKQLKKMLKDEKNEEYKDQIYYALATIEHKEGKIDEALKYYKMSAQTSVSNNTQKAISFLALADIYFNQKNYIQSGYYYDSTMQYLDKNYTDYDAVSKRAENTGLLVQYLGEVQRQDSLQRIANMPEKQRMQFIDSLIQEVIAEEQRQRQEDNNFYYDPTDFGNTSQPNSQGGKWYMYNPVLVSRGKNEFKKKWGNRKLEDNWRRKNKAVVSEFGDNEQSETEGDSSRITDNKKPEYYLQDLPLNDSLMQISNTLIAQNLFNAAEVYQLRLNEPKSAIDLLEELLRRFPDTDLKLDAYYKLYNLYSQTGNQNKADYYKDLIIINFPDSKYAKILQDPNFLTKLAKIEDIALKLYQDALVAYNSGDYVTSLELVNQGINKYSESEAYPYYLFLKGKNYGSMGVQDSLIFYLQKVSKNYARTEIANLSNDILALIESGKYNYDIYKLDETDEFYYVVVIRNKLNTNELRFKLKVQAETFTDAKTFTIKSDDFGNSKSLITVMTFDNAQEVRKFYDKVATSNVFSGIQQKKYTTFFISKNNYEIFVKDKDLDKYLYFFKKSYLPDFQ
jgi:tetratricopeptide (TPR) repeat protein